MTALSDFAAKLCDAPVALVSLVSDERQSFLARTGFEARHTPRETSFCAHAMEGSATMVVPDARLDPRFCDNPLVTGDPHIRFYAGAPLHSAGGRPLGALCVIDYEPRDGLTPLQSQGLAALAQAVMALFEAQRARISSQQETSHVRGERDEREQRFRVLADSMPQMVWSTLPDGFHDYYNARWYDFTGVPEGSTNGEGWNGMFHPEDQERAWAAWRHSLTTGDPYEIEYRLRDRHGDYRWVLGRALPMRDANGRIIRWFGTCTDIHDHKMAMDQREMISHELSHRIKNIFSVINGLIGLSSREDPASHPFADKLRERVIALGKAHDFVRPHSEASRPSKRQTSLHGMLEELLSAYQVSDNERLRIEGEDIDIDDQSATPLALLFHELATNAAKYGALSSPDGRVEVSIRRRDDRVLIEWTETGGPAPTPSDHVGFGSRLIAMSAERQLGGSIEREWAATGLKVYIDLPANSMSRN
ncbi:MAG TPA: PAS domain-containing protein [Sphingomicrobium sp.]|nr:PAS domain-containing protein [Sphingomicrobium sp.]